MSVMTRAEACGVGAELLGDVLSPVLGKYPVPRGAVIQARSAKRMLMHARPFAAPLMAPGIHHDVHKNHKPQGQQDDRDRLFLPNRMKIFGDLIQIHAGLIYTSSSAREIASAGIPWNPP